MLFAAQDIISSMDTVSVRKKSFLANQSLNFALKFLYFLGMDELRGRPEMLGILMQQGIFLPEGK
jgi:hypothetical protein